MQETKKRQRSCIGCGKQAGKASLLRVVRTSSGSVAFDPTGRAPGRGAYVCSVACFERARAAHKFDRAFRTKLTEQDYEKIACEFACAGGSDGATVDNVADKTEE